MKKWKAPEGYIEKRYNYTYKLTFKYDNRYYYYGTHSTNIDPKFDNYYGSGSNIKKLKKIYGNDCFDKEILGFYQTKLEALLEEEKLVPIEILKDEFCLNKIKGGGTFDTTGIKVDDSFRKQVSERFKGKKRDISSINKMVNTRRLRGTDKHSEETKEKIRESKIGRIFIHNGDIMKNVIKDELDFYLNQGWEIGYSEKRNEKIRLSKIGERNPMHNKKVSQETINKMLDTKLKNGTNKHSEETIKKLTEINRLHAQDENFKKHLSECCKGVNTWSKGRKFINKDGILKSVKLDEIEEYVKNGWNIGRKCK